MRIFQIIYVIHQITFIFAENCKPDCSNRPKRECQKFEIELRASLVRCTSTFPDIPETTTPVCDSSQKPKDNKNFLKCLKKIAITLKLTNQGETTTTNQYIIIDHVKDGKTGEQVSLLNPYVIVIRQENIMQLYGLKFLSVVNGEVTEKVIKKRHPNFRQNPTCEKLIYKGKYIPYSEGFHCSCDEDLNARRQSQMMEEENDESPSNLQEFIYDHIKPNNEIVFNHPKRARYKRNNDWYDYNDYLRRYRYQRNPQNMVFVTPKIYRSRYNAPNYPHYPQSGDKTRGGQNCKRNTTSDESEHCAQFSQMWYSVYELSNPVLEHTIYVKIFEKREKTSTGTDWFDLTAGSAIQIGSLNLKYINMERSLQVKYYNTGIGSEAVPFALDPITKRILIRRNSKKDEGDCAFENPAEYLVVDKKLVNSSGECNTPGVGYKAFFTQPRRCSLPPGSCLKNQPNDLWRRDKRACKRSNQGQYFLKNFARVPTEDALRTTKDKTKYLALYLDENLKSAIDIDIQIDDNIAFQNQARSQITEVYVDGTSESVTIITIKLFNSGLISSTFHPKLSDCPLELPVDWSNLEGDPVLIPPQHHAIFTMRLFGAVSVTNFYCTVQVLNDKTEVLAMRRIRIVKDDRCVCAWHCRCACLMKTGLGCKLISSTHYKAAGFIGSMPLTTTMVQQNSIDRAMFSFCYGVLLFCFILLMMGSAKALIGICYVPVGIWGLDILIGTRPLLHYYEKDLRCRHVIYDHECFPVHPDTLQRIVRITPKSVEFFLNIIFFFTYPIMLILILSIKLCCPYNPDKIHEAPVETCAKEKRRSCISDSEDLDQFEFDELSSEAKHA